MICSHPNNLLRLKQHVERGHEGADGQEFVAALAQEIQDGKKWSKDKLKGCKPAATEEDVTFFDEKRVFQGEKEKEPKTDESKETERKETVRESVVERGVGDEEIDFDEDPENDDRDESKMDESDDC
jgi:hypothetical protein